MLKTIYFPLLIAFIFSLLGACDSGESEQCMERTGCYEGEVYCFCSKEDACHQSEKDPLRCSKTARTCIPQDMTKEEEAEVPTFCGPGGTYFGPDSSQH